jgi:hypothetical protein
MQTSRNAHLLVRFMLVWFVLFLGVAVAAPLVAAQTMELICLGSGGMKQMQLGDDGGGDVMAKTMDCPLCASASAPPSVAQTSAAPVSPLAYVMRSIAAAHIAALTAAPLPARGPPAFF